MTNTRKIIQFSVDNSSSVGRLYVLCDDGTLWTSFRSNSLNEWKLMEPPIPQGDPGPKNAHEALQQLNQQVAPK